MKFKIQYKICVSGASGGDCLSLEMKKKAELIGAEIARKGAILTTGATSGLPWYAARGVKKAGGLVFGFSPAATKGEHGRKYRLPLNYMDVIVFTGSGYAGRNLILTRSSDAVIVICGRIGTLNEFTVAFEDKKVIGILDYSGGISNELRDILKVSGRSKRHVLFESNPKKLVARVIAEIAVAEKHRH